MDVVLVHGTTQAASGWDRVVAVLRGWGHRTYAPELPVDHPDRTVADHVDLIAAQCPDATAPVVVAHSAGALLLPAIGARLGAARLVWVAAAVPDPSGRSFIEEARADGAEMFLDEWRTLTEPPTADPAVAAHFLFHDCDPATLRWALTTVRLFHPRAVYAERIAPPVTAAHTFILPTADRAVRPGWMRRVARERLGVEPVEIDAGHCPHVSRPAETARLIVAGQATSMGSS